MGNFRKDASQHDNITTAGGGCASVVVVLLLHAVMCLVFPLCLPSFHQLNLLPLLNPSAPPPRVTFQTLPQALWDDVADRMSELGFERGWGATAARIREQFRLLLDILQVCARVCVLLSLGFVGVCM